MTRSTFEGNNGFRGGAIYVKSATVHIRECTFKDNDGSGVGAQTTAGVAVYVEGTPSAPGIALVAGISSRVHSRLIKLVRSLALLVFFSKGFLTWIQ